MSLGDQIREEFERLGYQRIRPAEVPIKYSLASLPGSRVYLHESSSDDLRQIGMITWKPGSGCYGISVTAFSRASVDLASRLLPVLQPFLPPLIRDLEGLYYAFPLNPSRRCIPSINEPDWKATIAKARETFLVPRVWPVATPRDLMNLLLENDGQMSWDQQLSIRRAAHVFAAGRVAGVSPDEIKDRLEHVRPLLVREIQKRRQDRSPDDLCRTLLDSLATGP